MANPDAGAPQGEELTKLQNFLMHENGMSMENLASVPVENRSDMWRDLTADAEKTYGTLPLARLDGMEFTEKQEMLVQVMNVSMRDLKAIPEGGEEKFWGDLYKEAEEKFNVPEQKEEPSVKGAFDSAEGEKQIPDDPRAQMQRAIDQVCKGTELSQKMVVDLARQAVDNVTGTDYPKGSLLKDKDFEASFKEQVVKAMEDNVNLSLSKQAASYNERVIAQFARGAEDIVEAQRNAEFDQATSDVSEPSATVAPPSGM